MFKKSNFLNDKTGSKRRSPKPTVQEPALKSERPAPAIIQAASLTPGLLTPRAVLQLQRTVGNRAVAQLLADKFRPRPVQAKLSVREPGDRFEQEADQVARCLVSTLDMAGGQTAPSTAQRAAKIDGEDGGRAVQVTALRPGAGGGEVDPDVETSVGQSRHGGQPLAEGIRRPMARAFGADFSRVRVHVNARADSLGRALGAKAFTIGQDIFFRQGMYDPATRDGQELIAHELTHVMQQNGAAQPRHANLWPTRAPVIQRKIDNTKQLTFGEMQIHFEPVNAQEPDEAAEEVGSIVFTPSSQYPLDTDEILLEQLTREIVGGILKPVDKEIRPQTTMGQGGGLPGFYVDQARSPIATKLRWESEEPGSDYGFATKLQEQKLHFYKYSGHVMNVDIANLIARHAAGQSAREIQRQVGVAATELDKIFNWWTKYGNDTEPSNKTVADALLKTLQVENNLTDRDLETSYGVDEAVWALGRSLKQPEGPSTSKNMARERLQRHAELVQNQAGKKKGGVIKPATLHDTPGHDRPITYQFITTAVDTENKQHLGEARWGFEIVRGHDGKAVIQNEQSIINEPTATYTATAHEAREKFYTYWGERKLLSQQHANPIMDDLKFLDKLLNSRPEGVFPNIKVNQVMLERLNNKYRTFTNTGNVPLERMKREFDEISLFKLLWT